MTRWLAIVVAVLRPLSRRQRTVLAAERARHDHAARRYAERNTP